MKKLYKTNIFLTALGICLAAVLFIVLQPGKFPPDDLQELIHDEKMLLYQGWTVPAESDSQPLELPVFIPSRQGETVRISNTLPIALKNGTYLAFQSANNSVEVSLNGKLVYSNIIGEPADRRSPFPMWNFVELKESDSGSEISLQFFSVDPYETGIIPEILLGTFAEDLTYAISSNDTNMQLSICTMFIGVLSLLFALVAYSKRQSVIDFILLGFFFLALGCSQAMLTVIPRKDSYTYFAINAVGTGVFGLLPPFYCFYCRQRTNGKVKRSYTALFWIGIIFYFFVYALHWLNVRFTWSILRPVTYLVFLAIYGACFINLIWREKEQGVSVNIRALLAIGLGVFIVSLAVDGFTHVSYMTLRGARPIVCGSLIMALLHTSAVILSTYEHVEMQMETAKELSEERIKLMISQMKPHFIRNSLSEIRALILYEPKKAYDLLYDFTNYITFNIQTMEGTEPIPFSDEVAHIRAYTEIEQELLSNRLQIEYAISCDHFEVPPLSVQPFVENAIKHGIWPKMEGGTLRLESTEVRDSYIIRIIDNGQGFDTNRLEDPAKGHGIGMKNAVYRLRTLVGASVDIQSKLGEGTTVTITIPKLLWGDEDEDDIG